MHVSRNLLLLFRTIQADKTSLLLTHPLQRVSLLAFWNRQPYPCRRSIINGQAQRSRLIIAHLFLIASFRPIFLAEFTTSARLTFPMDFLFIFEGFGNLSIHSGTVEPDCSSTLAMLKTAQVKFGLSMASCNLRFQVRCIVVCEICDGLSFAASSPSTT